MDDTKAGQLPREQPRQIPAPPDRVHQRRHRSPERDCSDQSSLPDTRETACSARDPCPQQSASSNPPQQRQNHRCENPMKQSVFTQPRSLADIGASPTNVRFAPESGHSLTVSGCQLCAIKRHLEGGTYSLTSFPLLD